MRKLRNRILPYLFVLRRTRYSLPGETKLSLYYAYIHSHLSYLMSIWGFSSDTNLSQLQTLQNKAIRSLFWQEYRQSNTIALFERHRIPRVEQMRNIDSALMIYKLKHGLVKNSMHLRTFRDVHEYQTRGRDNFVLPNFHTTLLQNSIFSAGLSMYNRIPSSLKQLHSIYAFKKGVKSYFMNQPQV